MRTTFAALLALLAVLGCRSARGDEASDLPDARALARSRLTAQATQVIEQGALGSLTSARGSLANVRAAVRQDWDAADVRGTPLGARLSWLLGLDEGAEDPSATGGALLEAVFLNLWLTGDEAGGRYAWRAAGEGGEVPPPRLLNSAEWDALDAEERDGLLGELLLDLARLGDGGREPSSQLDLSVPQASRDPVARLRAPPALAIAPALLYDDELADEVSELWLRVRSPQAQGRLAAWGKEKLSQLITEAELARYTGRVDAVRVELNQIRDRELRVLAALDRLVGVDMELNRRIFLLDQKLEAATKEGAPDAAHPELARLRLEGTSLRLEQQLLYLTVVRAERRLALYERARDQLQQEAVAAETVRDRGLQRVRRARRALQLAHLAHDRGWIEANREQALESSSKDVKADRGAWEAYVGILDDLGRMTGLMQRLVEVRQSLEMHVAVEAEEEEAPDSETPSAEFVPDEGAPSPTSPAGVERFGMLSEPARYVHRPGFITAVRAALSAPGFDAELVARTYAAIDEYVRQRRRALDAATGTEELLAEYEALGDTLPTRLEAVEAKLPSYMAWDIRQIRERGRPYADLRDRTMEGIREERKQARRQIAERVALRRELMDLGERSLAIRADRSLDAEALREGTESLQRGARRALGWLTLTEAPHLGTFVSSHLPQVLVALLLACLLATGVWIGRRHIDSALGRLSRAIPALDAEELTVGNEAAEARAARRRERDAVQEAETAALRETSEEAAEEGEPDTAQPRETPPPKAGDEERTR